MAKSVFTPPSTSGFRNITDTAETNGNIYNVPRYPQIGGFNSSKKYGKSPFKTVPPKKG